MHISVRQPRDSFSDGFDHHTYILHVVLRGLSLHQQYVVNIRGVHSNLSFLKNCHIIKNMELYGPARTESKNSSEMEMTTVDERT